MSDVLGSIRRMMKDDEALIAPASGMARTTDGDRERWSIALRLKTREPEPEPDPPGPDQYERLEAVIRGDRTGWHMEPEGAREPPLTGAEGEAAAAPGADAKETEDEMMDDAGLPMTADNGEEDAVAERPEPAREPQRRKGMAAGEPLMSDRTRAAVDQSFASLSRTLLAANPRTVEDLLRDMMRPMLREWLDGNLPEIAERMVRHEIDRITAGRS